MSWNCPLRTSTQDDSEQAHSSPGIADTGASTTKTQWTSSSHPHSDHRGAPAKNRSCWMVVDHLFNQVVAPVAAVGQSAQPLAFGLWLIFSKLSIKRVKSSWFLSGQDTFFVLLQGPGNCPALSHETPRLSGHSLSCHTGLIYKQQHVIWTWGAVTSL